MSDSELERAAMAPRRWIELCGGALQKRSNDSSDMLHPRTTRIINHAADSVFIVPGGRYLVTESKGIFVWDLGYVSTVDCELVSSVDRELVTSTGLGGYAMQFMVQTTPDGKGLVILWSYR